MTYPGALLWSGVGNVGKYKFLLRDFVTCAATLAFDCKQSNIRWLSETVASQPTASMKVAAWNAGDAPGPNVLDGALTTGAVFLGELGCVVMYSKNKRNFDMIE